MNKVFNAEPNGKIRLMDKKRKDFVAKHSKGGIETMDESSLLDNNLSNSDDSSTKDFNNNIINIYNKHDIDTNNIRPIEILNNILAKKPSDNTVIDILSNIHLIEDNPNMMA